MMPLQICVLLFGLVFLLGASSVSAQDDIPYEGRKKCSGCHKSQYQSWRETGHAKALESLKPGMKTEAKIKAKLDPDKDYSNDKNCVACHVTGFDKEGGYSIDNPGIYTVGVGCESCHGPGSEYQLIHRKAAQKFDRTGKASSRRELADAGEEFQFAERCNACHMNYEGSTWPDASKPYTPFTPEVDPKYAFDFDKAVRNHEAMHEHFKLVGVFTGPPLPPFHQEFQQVAKPTGAAE